MYWGIFKYDQQDATLYNLFVSVKCATCFRRFLRPSSGAQTLYMQHTHTLFKLVLLPATVVWQSTRCCIYSFWAPDDGRKNRLKHVEYFTEINSLCNVASGWLYVKIRLRCTDPWTSHVLWKTFRKYGVTQKNGNFWKTQQKLKKSKKKKLLTETEPLQVAF